MPFPQEQHAPATQNVSTSQRRLQRGRGLGNGPTLLASLSPGGASAGNGFPARLELKSQPCGYLLRGMSQWRDG